MKQKAKTETTKRFPKYDPQPGDALRPIRQTGHGGRQDVIVVERRAGINGDSLLVRKPNNREVVLSFETWNKEYRPAPKNQDEDRVLTEDDIRRIIREEIPKFFGSIGANR